MTSYKLIALLAVISCLQADAQVGVVNNGGLNVHSGATISVNGTLNNKTSATLINDGSIYLNGTLTNDETGMSPGTGSLYLNGSTAQSVAGTASFKTYNLITANSAGITLNNDLSVSGTHTFSAGLIHSSAIPNYLIYEAGASYTGDGDTRHMTGWVKKKGNTGFIFPFGNGTHERTAAIAVLSASS